MPGSIRTPEGDTYIRDFILYNDINTALDVGAGSGTYFHVAGDIIETMDAVEVWTPYIREYNLHRFYNRVFEADIRDFTPENDYDLVIFGDILEHMSEKEAQQVWSFASYYAKWGLISVPIIHYPQGAEFGNPYEVHVQEHLTPGDMTRIFGDFDYVETYPVTGTFIKRFR